MADPHVGREIDASVRGILAICRHLDAAGTVNPQARPALGLVAQAARVLKQLNLVTSIGSLGRMSANPQGREVCAALILLLGMAEHAPNRVTVGVGAQHAVVIKAVHEAVFHFERENHVALADLSDEQKLWVASRVSRVLADYVGVELKPHLLISALGKVHDDWEWHEDRVPGGGQSRKKADPNRKAQVFVDLLRRLGLAPQGVGAVHQSVKRHIPYLLSAHERR